MWIESQDGRLYNLTRAEGVFIVGDDDECDVVVAFPANVVQHTDGSNFFDIFTGSREECEALLNQLSHGLGALRVGDFLATQGRVN